MLSPGCARSGYNTEVAEKAVASGHADAVAFGRRFLATPDMVKRVRLHAPLNQYHRETFYTQDQARSLTHRVYMGLASSRTLRRARC